MPLDLTDNPADYPSEITVPLNGDARADTSVQTPFQQLANRTANLKARADAIALTTDNGVRSLRFVASDAALLALAGAAHSDKSVAVVVDVGLYFFDAASTAVAQAPFVRQPTDVIGGNPGRWILLPFGALNVAHGIPQLDGSARIAAGTVRNGIALLQNTGLFLQQTQNAGFVDMTGAELVFASLNVGDIVLLDYNASIITGTGNVAAMQIYASTPPSSTGLLAGTLSQVKDADSWAATASASAVYVVTVAGTHTFQMQVQCAAFAATFQLNNLRAMVIRA